MKNSKKMEKDEWIAKFMEDLKLKNEEEFEGFIIRNYKIEYEDANTGERKVSVPEIEMDDLGIWLDYDLEHENGKYTDNGQIVDDALKIQILKYNYYVLPTHTSLNNRIDSMNILLGIYWDKLENIIIKEGMQ